MNDFVGFCAVEWSAEKSPQASHPVKAVFRCKSPGIFDFYSIGGTHFLNFAAEL